jgi:class 3 adenylate cyclase/pimeloyl-ACP methyl ester carboxylesterase
MRADDLRAVMDAVGCESAVIVGLGDGGALAAFFAATYPQRVSALIPVWSFARAAWAPDYPGGMTWEHYLADAEDARTGWGTLDYARSWAAIEFPSRASDEAWVRWFARMLRHAVSPGEAIAFHQVWYETDVRAVLDVIRAPTLVIGPDSEFQASYATRDNVAADQSVHLAANIAGAKLVVLPGARDFPPWGGEGPALVAAIDEFLRDTEREQADFDRVLATVLFTDLVGSTERAAELGDHAWKQLLERHHRLMRTLLERYRGVEVATAGDGFFATFDGPARAVRCAQAMIDAVKPLGIEIRAGLHTGEVQQMGDNIGGIAVHIGARVGALAGPSQVLVSSTVRDLVGGSGLTFNEHGVHDLKGVPGTWHVYMATTDERLTSSAEDASELE